jgi:CRP/FNR family transcriptional regulator, cyclic AMP receptor protein
MHEAPLETVTPRRAKESPDLCAVLRNMPLFADLNDRALTTLGRAGRIDRAPQGRMLFDQAEPADAVYVVRSGCIAILLSTPDGRGLEINEIRAGELFGELAVLTDQSRSTGAIVREAGEIIVIPREAFLAALDLEPKLVRQVLTTTAQRLRVSSERESALAFTDAAARLAQILLQLDRQASAAGYVTISQEELAQRVGLTRQTVAKILGRWRRTGWLLTGRGKIVLLNRVALRRRVEEVSVVSPG